MDSRFRERLDVGYDNFFLSPTHMNKNQTQPHPQLLLRKTTKATFKIK